MLMTNAMFIYAQSPDRDTLAIALKDTFNVEDMRMFESEMMPVSIEDSFMIARNVADEKVKTSKKQDRTDWKPNPKKALWLSIVLPGAGQIYNRKYWKLPLVYGGFVGCIYAMSWNNQMYNDYSQAYLDIMDNDPNTQSYNQFLHLGTKITDENASRYKDLFRRRKDRYRRWRDLSFFVMAGVYALSVIDAYVDASLSEFDISRDLSLKVSPSIINGNTMVTTRNPIANTALGLQCSLCF